MLGGVLTGGLGREGGFFDNVSIGALGLVLAPLAVVESRDASASVGLEVAGAVRVTVGLTLLIYGLTRI